MTRKKNILCRVMEKVNVHLRHSLRIFVKFHQNKWMSKRGIENEPIEKKKKNTPLDPCGIAESCLRESSSSYIFLVPCFIVSFFWRLNVYFQPNEYRIRFWARLSHTHTSTYIHIPSWKHRWIHLWKSANNFHLQWCTPAKKQDTFSSEKGKKTTKIRWHYT